jgi:hypothetical protein
MAGVASVLPLPPPAPMACGSGRRRAPVQPRFPDTRAAAYRGKMGSMEIIEFLEARIAEDEEAARHGRLNSVLQPLHDGGQLFQRTAELPPEVKLRVLAECAAKRKIIAHYQRIDRDSGPAGDPDYMEQFLFILAEPYKHHPDFSDLWAA